MGQAGERESRVCKKTVEKKVFTFPFSLPSPIVFDLYCCFRNAERPGKGPRETFPSDLENAGTGCFKKLGTGFEENSDY